MSDHYFIVADHGHLKIFRVAQDTGQREPSLSQVGGMDFPAGRQSYTDGQAAMAGRFQSSKHQAAAPGAPGPGPGRTGMSIDERLPMKREEERRRTRDVAEGIEAFFSGKREATWDFACAPDFHRAVVEHLSGPLRQRLRRTITKDLVNQPNDQLRAHFTEAGRR